MKVLLKDIADIKAGQGAPQDDEDYSRNGIPFIKAGNLQQLLNGLDVNNLQKVSNDVASQYKLRLYPKGTILFAKSGMSCMKGYIYVLPCNAYVVNHLACIIPYGDYSDYLKYYLTYHKPSNLIKDNSYPSISLNDIGNQIIDFKTEKKQKTIVKQMKLLEQNISCLKKASKKYDDFIKARFIEMFGDPVADTKNWGQTLLKEHLESIKYGTSTPPIFTDDGYAFIRATNIKNGKIVANDMKYIPQEEADRLEKCKLSGGEIIIVRSGVNAGDTCVVTDEYIGQYAGYDMILVLSSDLHPVFFNTLINTEYMDKVVKPLTRRAAQPHLNSEQTQRLPIIEVPFELQKQFADFVQQVDKSRFDIKKSITEIEREVLYD